MGSVDDPLERQADAAADRVLAMPDPALTASRPPAQLRRKCTDCAQEDEENTLQAKPAPTANPTLAAPPSVHHVLSSPGRALDPAARAFFEPRFGADFSDVRVHTDSAAAASAETIGALGYTVGRHVAFASNQYAPHSPGGRRLLAHELAHVVQQSATPSRTVRRLGDDSQIPSMLPCPTATSGAPTPSELVLFSNAVADLTADQRSQIAAVARRWNADGNRPTVRIDGFASTPGEEALNWQLSCSRAIAVKNELMTPSDGSPGVPDASIQIFMHGQTAEFGDEAQNRRASLSITAAPQNQQPTPDQPAPQQPQPDQPTPAQPPPAPVAARPQIRVWIRAFIPSNLSSARKLTKGPHAGEIFFPGGPGLGCFETDGRMVLSPLAGGTSRMALVFDLDTAATSGKLTRSGGDWTYEVDCDTGEELCRKLPTPTVSAGPDLIAWPLDFQLSFTGTASDPCVAVAPNIKATGSLGFDVAKRRFHWRIDTDYFPAWEAFVSFDGAAPTTLFSYLPAADSTPLRLIAPGAFNAHSGDTYW